MHIVEERDKKQKSRSIIRNVTFLELDVTSAIFFLPQIILIQSGRTQGHSPLHYKSTHQFFGLVWEKEYKV